MIWVLYAAESVIAGVLLTASWALVLWLWHDPLWLPLVLVAVGFTLRLGRRVPTWVSAGHGVLRRRIEER